MTLGEFFVELGQCTALGSVGVVLLGLLGLFGWIGKILLNRIVERMKSDLQRELESHKTSLQKSEFFFEKQYAAASEFIALRRSFLPPYSPSNMDWDDIYQDMAMDLEKIEKGLEQFVSKHAVVMKTDSVDELTNCIGIAGKNKFEVTRDEVSMEAFRAVGTIWDKLKDVERVLREAVRQQSRPDSQH